MAKKKKKKKPKKLYMLVWRTESGDRGTIGYWDKPLTEAEQHGYFAGQDDDYDLDEENRYVYWDMEEMELQPRPKALPKEQWLEGC